MSTDGNLRSIFRERMRDGFHWQAIETDLMGPGTPDVNYCSEGAEGWIENKQTTGWAVTLRVEQVGWLVRRASVGGRVFVAVRRWHDGGPRIGEGVDELWLFDGRWARELKKDGLGGAERLGAWGGGPSQWDWDEVRHILTRPLSVPTITRAPIPF